MTIQRSRLSVLATLLLAAGLSFSAQAQTATKLKIGTFGGPFEQVSDAAARAGKRLGLDITPVIFSNAVLPNEALVGNEIDGNAYQHTVYLNAEVRRRGFKIVQAAEIYTVPLAIYSAKHRSLAELPKGARIAIPSDEANQGRALLALQDHGLVKIKAGLDRSPSLLDVVENPKDIKFLELAVPAVPKALPDVDAIAVNANVAHQQASLTLKQAIAVEKPETTKRYTQLLVIREADKDKPWVPTLVSAYRSPEVRQLIETQFKDVMTPAF